MDGAPDFGEVGEDVRTKVRVETLDRKCKELATLNKQGGGSESRIGQIASRSH